MMVITACITLLVSAVTIEWARDFLFFCFFVLLNRDRDRENCNNAITQRQIRFLIISNFIDFE